MAEARTEDQSVRIKKFVELEYSLFLAHHALSDLLKNGNDIGRERKLEAYDLLLQAELAAFQIGTIFAPELASSRIYTWGGIAFINFNRAIADRNPESREAISRVVISLAESVAYKSSKELGVPKLAGVFAARAKGTGRLSFVDVINFAHIVAAKGGGWVETAKGMLERAEQSAFYLRTMLEILVAELESDVVQHRDRESLKELVAFIRAKRGYLKKIPKPGDVKKLLDKMERENWFSKAKDKSSASVAASDEE